MAIKISTERPPIWDEAHKHYVIDDYNTIYTYGDTLYNPGNVPLNPYLLAHEELHVIQQKQAGGPEQWWAQHFAEPAFRADQELRAYAVQYAEFAKRNFDRNKRFRYLYALAGVLAGETYGYCMTRGDAIVAIKKLNGIR